VNITLEATLTTFTGLNIILFLLRVLAEKYKKFDEDKYICYVDFKRLSIACGRKGYGIS